MARQCEICGKGSSSGGSKKQRGRPKSEGGVGRKTTGRAKRRFKANIQKVKALVDGSPKTIHVCTQCLKQGKVRKYV